MIIEATLILTKFFPRGVSKVKFGRYEISPQSLFSSTEVEAKLSFNNAELEKHPEEEVDIICRLLSVFLNARIRKMGTMADEYTIPVFDGKERTQYPQFFGYLEPSEADDLIKRVLTLDEVTARQYIRACRCYSYALELLPSDPAFAFFLLVASAECMSSQYHIIPFSEIAAEKKLERFCNFVIKYLPEDFKNEEEKNTQLTAELLTTAYDFYKEAFMGGKKEIASASAEADKNAVSYSKITVDGKEVKAPGLAWLTKVLRGALIGYLRSLSAPSKVNEELLTKLALEKARLKQ